mmetsp:Transcript_19835/g.33197  ORF Transcript_19835/g.33197 Transcript_19835/m.33197 type:complete len:120 (+) Transcript_19835:3215-3574(+)
MKDKFPEDPDLITTEKCRGKYHKLMEDYSAYHLIKNTSGLGSGSDESVWRELTVKNAIVLKFRDMEFVFAHYARMFEVWYYVEHKHRYYVQYQLQSWRKRQYFHDPRKFDRTGGRIHSW